MNIPKLRQQKTIKKCHGISWEDNYSWIQQENILEVLKDSTKLNPEVRKYLEENNKYTEYHLKNTKDFQKKLFDEIKGRIKLDDESLPYTDKKYIYWTKTTKKTNYAINLRKKIGSNKIEEYWSGEKEKIRLNTEYFGIGDLEVSHNDEMLAYSLDLKGSEYFTIYVRRISDNKIVSEEIKETSGSVTWSLDDKYIFDLRGFINNKISDSNIKNIENIEMDTFTAQETFYSYRRSYLNNEKDYGRCISVILMT